MRPAHWKLWYKKRAYIQKNRIISDRALLKDTVSGIYFQDASVENPLLTHIGNPIMRWYYDIVIKKLVRW